MLRRLVLSVCVMLGVGLAVAEAHEVRLIGAYTFAVGFRGEPAFEDVVNAVDIFINRTSDGKAINVSAGDSVDLEVEVQLRTVDDFNGAILAATPLAQKPAQAFGADNRYNSWFKPTHDGVHGFRIIGTIADSSDPQAGQQEIDATFVCGGGTQSHTSRFNCVADPQTFPGGPRAGYRDNNAASFE
jgi:hypothetical protein